MLCKPHLPPKVGKILVAEEMVTLACGKQLGLAKLEILVFAQTAMSVQFNQQDRLYPQNHSVRLIPVLLPLKFFLPYKGPSSNKHSIPFQHHIHYTHLSWNA